MAERSLKKEVQKLRLGEGEVFHGEGILVVTKALLQSGVSYVGAIIIVGEDYGEGSSIMQERSHAFAMKSQMWLLDPVPTCLRSCARRSGGSPSRRPATRR